MLYDSIPARKQGVGTLLGMGTSWPWGLVTKAIVRTASPQLFKYALSPLRPFLKLNTSICRVERWGLVDGVWMTESQPSHKDWCLLLESNFSGAKWVITKCVCTLHLWGLHISEWMQHSEDTATWFWTSCPLKPQSKLTCCKLPILGLHLCHCLDFDGPMTPVLKAQSLGWWIGSCWPLTDEALWMLLSWLGEIVVSLSRWQDGGCFHSLFVPGLRMGHTLSMMHCLATGLKQSPFTWSWNHSNPFWRFTTI